MPKIIIEIDLEGETTVDAQGFNGHGCKEATKDIERALGKTTKDAKKPEFTRQSVRKQAKQ